MKPFIKHTAQFMLLVIVLYPLLLFIWGSLAPQFLKTNLHYRIGSYGHMHSRLKEVKKTTDVDVLILGSSHAYRGFDTRLFKEHGMTAFNLGSSSQSPIQTNVLLKRYLDRLHPKLIIYEVYPATFTVDGVESAMDLIANDRNDGNTLMMALKINHLKVYNTLVYGSIRDFFNLNATFTEPSVKDNDTYISGGYVEKKVACFRNMTYPEQTWLMNEEQLNAFRENLAMIKAYHIPFLLVNAPVTAAMYDSYTNNTTFDQLMKRNGTYYNFNKMPELNDSLHFLDADHLNQNGVVIFNEKLLKVLDK